MKVVRGIHVLQIALLRLQCRARVISLEYLGLGVKLGESEIGREETNEGFQKQHRGSVRATRGERRKRSGGEREGRS
jgi:hypothetical protein